MNKFIKILLIIILGFGALCILSIIYLSNFSPLVADDYSNLLATKSQSILAILKEFYLYWDGRNCSVQGIISLLFFKYDYKLLSYFYSICFILSCVLIIKILNNTISRIHIPKWEEIIISASIIIVLLWHGLRYLIAQVIYWPVGGFYMFSNLIMLFSIYITLLFARDAQINSNHKNTILFLIGIICGMGSYNATMGVITLYLFEFIICKLPQARKMYLISILANILGFIFVAAAPGNIVRANSQAGNLTHDLYGLLHNYMSVLLSYLRWSEAVILAALISGFIYCFYYCRENSIRIFSKHEFLKENLINLKWLLAALSTVIIFAFAPVLAKSRTSIFFMFFLFIFVSLGTINLLFLFHRRIIPFYDLLNKTYLIIPMLVFIYHMSVITRHIHKAAVFKEQLDKRYEYFSSHNNQDVLVKSLNPDLPFSIRWYELTADSSDSYNKAVAKFYGLKTVRAMD